MNLTELARILKVTPNELKTYLPEMGFDIGFKAIKINGNIANRIIKEWPRLKRKLDWEKAQEQKLRGIDAGAQVAREKKIIHIPGVITVREFCQIAGLPLNQVLGELMRNGVFTALNEKIDFDTVWLVGSELGLDVRRKEESQGADEPKESRLMQALAEEDKAKLLSRAPVIVVMGHVDHGKTKLLDAIRQTHVVEGEAGGITQHIGAYQAKHKGQTITFIDTPGHEAFTAMRSRGARIADIAILVVAADDGVMPQTIEAFRIIEAAKIPYVVAINKIDKESANLDRVKQELGAKLNIIPEDWGGKTICAPISALKNIGIDDLLDVLLLTAEAESANIIANPDARAIGTIIESNIHKGAGPVATILVQNGTLRAGDQLMLGGSDIGKVRQLSDYRGRRIESAGPAVPAQILGLKFLPAVGDMIEVGAGERIKHKKTQGLSGRGEQAQAPSENTAARKINLIIKSDVLGSAEAIEESLMKIATPEVGVKIIYKGLGNVSDGDLKRAEAANAKILGFNVKVPPAIEEVAREKRITISQYSIIYNLINDIKADIAAVSSPVITRVELGQLSVLAIFRTEKASQIIGGKITEGRIEQSAKFEIVRNKGYVDQGELIRLQVGKQNVSSAEKGEECGLEIKSQSQAQIGDVLNFYKEEKK